MHDWGKKEDQTCFCLYLTVYSLLCIERVIFELILTKTICTCPSCVVTLLYISLSCYTKSWINATTLSVTWSMNIFKQKKWVCIIASSGKTYNLSLQRWRKKREREGERKKKWISADGGGALVSNTHKSQSILIHIVQQAPLSPLEPSGNHFFLLSLSPSK